MHIAAHLAVPVYGSGPDGVPPTTFSNAHALRPQIFTAELSAPGPAIIVSLAYANPFFTDFESRRSMHARIDRQLRYVEEFCARHADHFVWARTPEEARSVVESGRTAVVHGIEVATKVLNGPADARAWAERGVAVITPVHLADSPLGGAWCQGGSLFVMNIPGCWRELLARKHRGLTPRGTRAIEDLLDAGIIVDMAHMSARSFADTLPRLADRGVAPVYTHVTADAIRHDPVALTDDEIRGIEGLGGLVGVTANLAHLAPKPAPVPADAARCAGSIDDFQRQWDHVAAVADGAPVAWGSDFQGGVDHPRPKYGPRGCDAAPTGRDADEFDRSGLAHPGLVEPMFAHLAAAGSDRRPLDASAERFLEIWERSRAAARDAPAAAIPVRGESPTP